MKSGINRILLPITVGDSARNAATIAVMLAKKTGAEVVALAVEDESPWYETTPLPFHSKTLNHTVENSDQSKLP